MSITPPAVPDHTPLDVSLGVLPVGITIPAVSPIAANVEQVAAVAAAIQSNSEVQAAETAIYAVLPKNVRNVLYELGKWLGIAGAAAGGVATAFTGNTALVLASSGAVALALTAALAKANVK